MLLVMSMALVQQDRPKPGSKTVLGIVSVQRLEGVEQGFLDDVLSPFAAPQPAVRHSQQRAVVTLNQFRELVAIASQDGGNHKSIRLFGRGASQNA